MDWTFFTSLFSDKTIYTKLIQIVIALVVGIICVRLVIFALNAALKRMQSQQRFIITRVAVYILNTLILVGILNIIGINLTAILGTIGILGIVVGIASQSSIGNIIAGIFLLSENIFEIGSVIKVDNVFGVVNSIDLLSVKLKTFDNTLVRIPNQTLLTAKLINITKYPIRRLDVECRIMYQNDLKKMEEIFSEITKDLNHCLQKPEPGIAYLNFSINGIEVRFSMWFEKPNFLSLKNEFFRQLKKKFEENDIKMTTVQLMASEAAN